MSRPALLVLGAALIGAVAAPSFAAAPPKGCTADALAFSEALEPVVEAVTDGQPSKAPAAAGHAQKWWDAHRARFAKSAAIDSAMRELKSEAAANHANLAARAAVLASTSALDACPEAPTDDARLMRIDLTGMAGWLRAHGVDVAFPRNARQATHEVGDRLRARNHGALADQLTKDVEATLAIPVGANGDVASANRLLQRVDDAEKAVR